MLNPVSSAEKINLVGHRNRKENKYGRPQVRQMEASGRPAAGHK